LFGTFVALESLHIGFIKQLKGENQNFSETSLATLSK